MRNNFFENFKNPPKEYSMAPFWFLNDDLEPKHLEFQLSEMAEKGVFECVAHARKGLTVPYLSEKWFDRIGVILNKAKELGIRVWIYDEDNWPSGYAGGRVVEGNPEYAARCLTMEKIIPVLNVPIEVKEIPEKPIVRIIASHRNVEFFDITNEKGWASPELQYEVFVFRSEVCGHKPAYSAEPYVDLLNKKATEKFISVTHAEYKKRFPEHWGSTIKGFFTDEPGFYQNYLYQAQNLNTIPWTEGYPEYFKTKKGYDIVPYLCSIWDDMGELSDKTRHDFFDVLSDLYNESFFSPLQDFLKPDGLLSIGHLHMEEHLENTVPMESDFFRAMEHLDYAGIDRIDRERRRITEKLGAAACHLQNKKFCFSESMGCFGWGLTLEEIKSEIDWQYVLGVNKLVPHAFFSSTEGFRKTECPPSFFYQNTFWKYFRIIADYVSRLSFALSEGNFKAKTLIYYPIKSCWQQFKPLDTYNIRKMDEDFINISMELLENQIDFDYLYDEALKSDSVNGDKINLSGNDYSVVVIPPITVMPDNTRKALEEFSYSGGIVIDLSGSEILGGIKALKATIGEITDIYKEHNFFDLRLLIKSKNIKYSHRKIGNDDLYFIINESDSNQLLSCEIKAEGDCLRLDAFTGKAEKFSAQDFGGNKVVTYSLKPFESLLLYFGAAENKEIQTENWETVLPDGKIISGEPKPFSDLGLSDYSGTLEYRCSFNCDNNGEVILDLGEVYNIAEIAVNGKTADVLFMKPYVSDITDFLVSGVNNLSLKVSNTPANELTDEKKLSGLTATPKIYLKR